MSQEPSPRSTTPALPAQSEYEAICDLLMRSERGRSFLLEHARRSRSADTQMLLAAIERLESVVRAEREQQARQSFRNDLLEMAKAITRARAEVGESRQPPARGAPLPPTREGAPPPETAENGDIFASAERIRDVAWAMRGQGFDPSTCDQLDELAGSILAGSSLHSPTDRRAAALGEVLQYLEHRIEALLQGCSAATEEPREAAGPLSLPAPIELPPSPQPACEESSPAPAPPVDFAEVETAQWADWPAVDQAQALESGGEPNGPKPSGSPHPEPAAVVSGASELVSDAQAAAGGRSSQPMLPALDLSEAAAQQEPDPLGPSAAGSPVSGPTPALSAADPLAMLQAMSDIERIALFT
jgi:hypothetical protein